MGKNLIQQARGKGGPAYKSPSFNFQGEVKHPPMSNSTISGKVIDILHCRGHYTPLLLIDYDNGKQGLSIAPEGIRVGDMISCGRGIDIKDGNTLPLSDIPEGTMICNIESAPGDGGKFARTSGVAARVLARYGDNVKVMLPSKKEKLFSLTCRATVGIPAGSGRTEKVIMKAGTMYYKKKARNKYWPRSSASKMNAVDHPFGNSRSSRKSKARPAPHNAPPGRKVGMLRPRRTGRKSR